MTREPVDTLVIGAGVAGLTAAMYLARFRRSVVTIHDGTSRALRIPRTHNAPGFPDGIDGVELVERMTRHATEYGAEIVEGRVTAVTRDGEVFVAEVEGGPSLRARSVILATGIELNEVDLPREVHEQALRDHVLRYCPICDGHEATGKAIGVLGHDSGGAAEALFLRQYSDDIVLMPLHHPELEPAQTAELTRAGIRLERGALEALEPSADRMTIRLEGGRTIDVDILYPALGCRPRSDLALSLGLREGDNGCIDSRGPFGTDNAPGVYAAGDLVEGLDQISVAMGHGAVAATKAHNWLRERDGETLRNS